MYWDTDTNGNRNSDCDRNSDRIAANYTYTYADDDTYLNTNPESGTGRAGHQPLDSHASSDR